MNIESLIDSQVEAWTDRLYHRPVIEMQQYKQCTECDNLYVEDCGVYSEELDEYFCSEECKINFREESYVKYTQDKKDVK